MNLWDEAARLVESGRHPSDDIDAEVRKLIRERPWPEVGAVLLSTRLELSHGSSTEAEAATWAADLLPVLRPLGWRELPTGEALERAVLEAYRATT